MFNHPAYVVKETLYEGDVSTIYRGLRSKDQLPVILKTLSSEYPEPRDLVRLEHEYDLIREFSSPEVIRVHELEKYHHQLFLVLEDMPGGQTLKAYLNEKPLGIQIFIMIAINMVKALKALHDASIIHKDIKPTNILISAKDKKIKFIDFGIASRLPHERKEALNPTALEGTLAYISPEQTGRMNRLIDYRSDYYSLGATFYQMLTGKLPFESQDPMELVHCHIAKLPTPPHIVKADIPEVLSKLVMKLMAKDAEQRYQSTEGLLFDLKICLKQLKDKGEIEEFQLCRNDISARLHLAQKLYGRENEITKLLEYFDQVSKGAKNIIMVAGYSGVGKTSLVKEVQKPIVEKRGFFISGKFEQFNRTTPYLAFIQAFRKQIQQLLGETQDQLTTWKKQLLKSLGPNGQVIVDVIPELELIIGKQSKVPELNPGEARNRFNLTFQNFVKCFAQAEHPLVVFLDDMQWADTASLRLMEVLINDHRLNHFFLIGAYRDNEVDIHHPLLISLKGLNDGDIQVNTLTLKSLVLESVTDLLVDSMMVSAEEVKHLADLIFKKTGGNPFFINAFMETLYHDNHLHFDSQQRRWQWSVKEIESLAITENVVDLMTQKLKLLLEDTQQVLKLAACIGNQFDLKTLATVYEKSEDEIEKAIRPALLAGLILPLEESFGRGKEETETTHQIVYKFLHDRVQQGAYTLIKDSQRKQVHLKVGQLLLKSIPEADRKEKIFDIVNQLNEGMDLLTTRDEKTQLVSLNLMAGRKAKASAAYAPALGYLKKGMELLAKDCWERDYELSLSLFTEIAQVAYLNADIKLMESISNVVLSNAKDLLEKIQIYEILISAYTVDNQHIKAVQTGISVLKLLGVKLPSKPNKLHILRMLFRLKIRLIGKPIEKLIDLPLMTDPHKIAAMRVLVSISSPAYFALPDLFPLICMTITILSIKHGNSTMSTFGYVVMVFIFWMLGDIKTCKKFGDLAVGLVDRLQAKKEEASVLCLVGMCLYPWIGHLKEAEPVLLRAYEAGLNTGVLEYAGYSKTFVGANRFYMGRNLADVEHDHAEHYKLMVQLKQNVSAEQIAGALQMYYNIRVPTKRPYLLMGKYFDEEKMIRKHKKAKDETKLTVTYLDKLIVSYLFGEYSRAVENGDNVKYETIIALETVAAYIFYDSLARLAHYPSVDKKEQKRLMKKVKANSKLMKQWSKLAPENYLHKYYLIQAERFRVLSKDKDAEDYYDQAIEGAKDNEYVNDEAIASECAAKFYFNRKKNLSANAYLRNSHYCYKAWGAMAKVKVLEEQYPQLRIHPVARSLAAETTTTTTTTQTTTSTAMGSLDMISVVKASQTISTSLQLQQLLGNVIRILIENAGAERGLLLLEKNKKYLVEAENVIQHQPIVLQSEPYDKRSDLCVSIVQYVERSKKIVVLNNAMKDGDYSRDPYVKKNKTLSILCAPILNKGYLMGILYLENNLTAGAFTANRLEVLELLSAQAAISLENARLHKAYERFVPAEFLQQLEKRSIIDVELGDSAEKKFSVLFVDIRNFTSLSDKMTPRETFAFINSYIKAFEPVINAHGGFIDKYIGDAIMALFTRSADDAVSAGIGMLKELEKFNRERKKMNQQQIQVGIGVNTGELMLGTIGDERHMEGSVIGDTVNVASRLETLTKRYKTPFLISQKTRDQLKNPDQFKLRFVDSVKIKGKSKNMEIWEVKV